MDRLIPMLPVTSMPASVEFYQKLGFSVEGAPRQSVLYLYPSNIAEYHQEVRRNGLAVPDLDVTFYGMTELRLDDPDSNRLWIGQNTSKGAVPDQEGP